MPDLFAYLEGFGTGESFTKSVIIVPDLPTGSTVTATKGETVKTAVEENGEWWLKNLDLGEWVLTARKSPLDTSILTGGTNNGITVTPIGDGSLSFVGTATSEAINVWMWGGYNRVPDEGNTLFTIPSGTKIHCRDCDIFTVNSGKIESVKSGVTETVQFDFKVTGVRAPTVVSGQTYDKIINPAVQVIEGEAEIVETKFNIEQFGVYRIPMAFRRTMEFTYTGDYEIVDDDDQPINDFSKWEGNFKIRFLTSGTFTIVKLNHWDGRIDVFRVGGGAGGPVGISRGGSGSGYTNTTKDITLEEGVPYEITIGAGGEPNNAGGITDAFSETAAGGKLGSGLTGGPGGSGGGAGVSNNGQGKSGGSDGSSPSGKGQGTTTREFGDSSGKLYAGGGPGNGEENWKGEYGDPGYLDNTGTGGAADRNGTKGKSGIVVIRNAREVA